MKKLIKRVEEAAQRFRAADFALFKIYLAAVGVLLGAYFAPFFIANILWVWAVAVVAGVYICARLIWLACK